MAVGLEANGCVSALVRAQYRGSSLKSESYLLAIIYSRSSRVAPIEDASHTICKPEIQSI